MLSPDPVNHVSGMAVIGEFGKTTQRSSERRRRAVACQWRGAEEHVYEGPCPYRAAPYKSLGRRIVAACGDWHTQQWARGGGRLSDLALEARDRLEYISVMQDADLLTANEAAVLVGVTPDLIRRYVSSGRLNAVRNRHTIRIPRESIAKLVRQCGKCHERFVPENAGTNPAFCPACVTLERRAVT